MEDSPVVFLGPIGNPGDDRATLCHLPFVPNTEFLPCVSLLSAVFFSNLLSTFGHGRDGIPVVKGFSKILSCTPYPTLSRMSEENSWDSGRRQTREERIEW